MSAAAIEQLTLRLAPPRHSDVVHREECTQCFDNQDAPLGIDVCLSCFNGGCPRDSFNQHSVQHFQKTGHAIFVNIRRTRKLRPRRKSSEPPIKKLAIREESPDSEKFDLHTAPRIYTSNGDAQDLVPNDKLNSVVQSIMNSMSSAQKSEVKAWEEELTSCSHITELQQHKPTAITHEGFEGCSYSECGLKNNLWLCLTCGFLGCGRQQFGGGGGNGHGLQHARETGHSVAVKMGTIEPDGTADMYCYACDDARLDPNLAEHLANFGIEVAGQRKTEKSMTELQIEHNMTHDFAMTGEDGKGVEPLTGPGLTGLRNLGNSCYIASSLQAMFALPSFQEVYLTSFLTHPSTCSMALPANCFQCQIGKMADGILSGRYSKTSEVEEYSDEPRPVFQEGIRPIMFKSIVGKDHPEFSTMKQQDAGEFLLYLFEVIQRSAKATSTDEPTGQFGFSLEEKLQCLECHRVRYSHMNENLIPITVPVVPDSSSSDGGTTQYLPVQLTDCLDMFTAPVNIEYKCPACDKNVLATKTNRFQTFPNVLLLNAARFQHVNWVPRKVDVPLILPAKYLDLSAYLGRGKQEDEVELPEAESEALKTEFDPSAMAQLTNMGFPENRAQRALLATGNDSADKAMEWLFAHMEDPDIDYPQPQTPSNAAIEPSNEQMSMVTDMGFSTAQGRKALRETGGDVAGAVEWLFNHPDDTGDEEVAGTGAEAGAAPNADSTLTSPKVIPGSSKLPAEYRLKAFISHKGPSIHSGHYVAHVWKGDKLGWVLFNDEKVVKAEGGEQSAEKLMPLAYIYVFERKQ